MKWIKKIGMQEDGNLRIWVLVFLNVGAYLLSTLGAYYLGWYVYRAMTSNWGVTMENISRAPQFVRFLYQWWNVLILLAQNALLVFFAVLTGRFARGSRRNIMSGCMKGAGIGAATVAVLWMTLMLSGSVRLGWRISRPAFSINTLALAITTLAAAIGEGMYIYGTVYDEMKNRLPKWGAIGVVLLANIGMETLWGETQPIFFVNAALTALVCCLLADEGHATAVGFLFAKECIAQTVVGFAEYDAALYETYPVNMYWLNGGNFGVDNGLAMTIIMTALIVLIIRRRGVRALTGRSSDQ